MFSELTSFSVQTLTNGFELVWSLCRQFSLFALLLLVYLIIGRASEKLAPLVRKCAFGAMFGVGAVWAMVNTVALAPGLMIDARNVMIALAGAFGGPLTAATALVVGVSYRWWAGGAGVISGCSSMVFVAVCGTLVPYLRSRPRTALRPSDLLILAIIAGCLGSATVFFLPIEMRILREAFLTIMVHNTIGIFVFGLALCRLWGDRAVHEQLLVALDVQSQLAERHRVITDNVADGIITLDEAGTIQSFSSSAEWIFGSVAEDVIGRDVSMLLPASGAGEKQSIVHRHLKVGKAQVLGLDHRFMGLRRNGSKFPLELRIAEFHLGNERFFAASARDLTKAKAAEEMRAEAETKLRTSEGRFRDCATASSDYLWGTDSDHRFTYWVGGQHLAGLYPQSVIGRKRWDVAQADVGQEPWSHHIELLANQRSFKDFHFSMRTLDGKLRWFQSSGMPFYNEDGTLGGYRGASSDITMAVEAERQLKARAEQQHALALLGQLALQDNGQDQLFAAASKIFRPVLNVSMAALFLKSNKDNSLELAAEVGWGLGDRDHVRFPCCPETLPGRAFVSLVPLTHGNALANGLINRDPLQTRYEIVAGMAVGLGDTSRRSGALLVCAEKERTFCPDEQNFLQAVAVILSAAIERRRAEASLALRDRALESIGKGLVIADARKPELPVVYVNSAFARSRGGEVPTFLNQGLATLFANHGNPDMASNIRSDLAEQGFYFACVKKKTGGHEIWEDVTIKPLFERNTLAYYVCVQADVTSRMKLEAELRQAQKMDAVGKLTGGVAHDFNNLLTVILGNAELLAEDMKDPQSKLTAELILNAAERGSDLVQRLLAFGRRQALQPEFISVDDCIADIAELLRRTIGEDVAFATDLRSGGQTVFVDKSHLGTALLNLVTNARDAMAGGGELTIGTRTTKVGKDHEVLGHAPGDYLCLVVRDNGSGMSPEIKQRVFEPFFTTKQFGKGTGLGLSSVYGFVQQSLGHINIDTEVGRGTSVEILLPLKDGVINAERATLQPAMLASRERVLVVEDQDDVRDYVTEQLESLGYDVVPAAHAPDALRMLGDHPHIDLLFTDIRLPLGMDGFQLAEAALKCRPDLKVLFTSGYSDYAVERQSRLLDLGVPLLKKPYRRAELASALRGALERDRLQSSVRAS